MNGHATMPTAPGRPPNPGVVAVLEELLALARAGEMVSIGVVFSRAPGNIDQKICSSLPLELYMGCDMLQRTLFDLMTKPSAPSKVLRPFGGL